MNLPNLVNTLIYKRTHNSESISVHANEVVEISTIKGMLPPKTLTYTFYGKTRNTNTSAVPRILHSEIGSLVFKYNNHFNFSFAQLK